MSSVPILEERDLADDERAITAEEARPGVWVEEYSGFRGRPRVVGDGRLLTQFQTDCLIVIELLDTAIGRPEEARVQETVRSIYPSTTAMPRLTWFDRGFTRMAVARRQRGGIHSEPVIRLLAFRAWQHRDRKWRAADTDAVLQRAGMWNIGALG